MIYKEQFTRWDDEHYPRAELYFEHETVKTPLSEEVCTYGYKLDGKWLTKVQLIDELLRENERLVGLSGKTNYCLQCEAYARENEQLKKEQELTDRDCGKELAFLHERIKKLERVVVAAKGLINDMDCYCLDSEESLGRGPCETCKLAEALQALAKPTDDTNLRGEGSYARGAVLNSPRIKTYPNE